MRELLVELEKIMETLKTGGVSNKDVLIKLQSLLIQVLMYQQVSAVLSQVGELVDKPTAEKKNEPKKETDAKSGLELLADLSATRTVEGKREFLLHRATEDHEYANNARGNEFTTGPDDTSWYPEYMTEQKAKDGSNPVVSCWVPEEQIKIPEPYLNTGMWGELGKNPNAARFEVLVRHGVYQIAQEYKGS